jgi:hypothetical protein
MWITLERLAFTALNVGLAVKPLRAVACGVSGSLRGTSSLRGREATGRMRGAAYGGVWGFDLRLSCSRSPPLPGCSFSTPVHGWVFWSGHGLRFCGGNHVRYCCTTGDESVNTRPDVAGFRGGLP